MQRLKEYMWLFVLWFVVVGIGVIGAFWEYYQDAQVAQIPLPIEQIAVLPAPQPTLDTLATPPAFTANSVWAYDRTTDQLLFEENAQTATSVASLAKLMTALVSYDEYALDTSVPIGTSAAAIGNRAQFFANDTFSVYDLLHAMLIFSANDAAEALSRHHQEGMPGFVEQMNLRAQELGLASTHFSNPSGLDAEQQYSTAEDIGQLANAFLRIPVLAEIVSKPVAQVRELRTGRIDTIYTTNALLYTDPRYRGMKTGTTALAGESLVVRIVTEPFTTNQATATDSSTFITEPAHDIILVILGSNDRFEEAQTLTNWMLTTLQLQKQENI